MESESKAIHGGCSTMSQEEWQDMIFNNFRKDLQKAAKLTQIQWEADKVSSNNINQQSHAERGK